MNKHIRYLFIFSVSVIMQTAGFAQDSLTFYMQQAAMNNPGVRAKYLEFSAALEKVPQVSALPDPQASLGFFIRPMQLMAGNQVADVRLMQMFPWFGTLKAGKDEASMMAKARYEAFNAAKAELFFKVKSSWYQLMKYDREIDLVRKDLEVLESVERAALVKFQSSGAGLSQQMGPGQGSEQGKESSASMKNEGSGMAEMNRQAGSGNNQQGSGSSGSMAGGMSTSGGGLQDVLRVRMEILDQENKIAGQQ